MTSVYSRIQALAASSSRALVELWVAAQLDGSMSAPPIWPSIPWAAVATGPTNLFAQNDDIKKRSKNCCTPCEHLKVQEQPIFLEAATTTYYRDIYVTKKKPKNFFELVLCSLFSRYYFLLSRRTLNQQPLQYWHLFTYIYARLLFETLYYLLIVMCHFFDIFSSVLLCVIDSYYFPFFYIYFWPITTFTKKCVVNLRRCYH